jgi:hypothetical protein
MVSASGHLQKNCRHFSFLRICDNGIFMTFVFFFFGLDLFFSYEILGEWASNGANFASFLFLAFFSILQIDWRRDLSIGTLGTWMWSWDSTRARELTTARSAGNRDARAVVGTSGWA